MRSRGSDTTGRGASLGNSIFSFLLPDSNSACSISDRDLGLDSSLGWKNCLILLPTRSSSTTSVTTFLKNPERTVVTAGLSVDGGVLEEVGDVVVGEGEGEPGVEEVVADEDGDGELEKESFEESPLLFCVLKNILGSPFLLSSWFELVLSSKPFEEGFSEYEGFSVECSSSDKLSTVSLDNFSLKEMLLPRLDKNGSYK